METSISSPPPPKITVIVKITYAERVRGETGVKITSIITSGQRPVQQASENAFNFPQDCHKPSRTHQVKNMCSR